MAAKRPRAFVSAGEEGVTRSHPGRHHPALSPRTSPPGCQAAPRAEGGRRAGDGRSLAAWGTHFCASPGSRSQGRLPASSETAPHQASKSEVPLCRGRITPRFPARCGASPRAQPQHPHPSCSRREGPGGPTLGGDPSSPPAQEESGRYFTLLGKRHLGCGVPKTNVPLRSSPPRGARSEIWRERQGDEQGGTLQRLQEMTCRQFHISSPRCFPVRNPARTRLGLRAVA